MVHLGFKSLHAAIVYKHDPQAINKNIRGSSVFFIRVASFFYVGISLEYIADQNYQSFQYKFNSWQNFAPAVTIFKCQMVYICVSMNRFNSNSHGGGPQAHSKAHEIVYCLLILVVILVVTRYRMICLVLRR